MVSETKFSALNHSLGSITDPLVMRRRAPTMNKQTNHFYKFRGRLKSLTISEPDEQAESLSSISSPCYPPFLEISPFWANPKLRKIRFTDDKSFQKWVESNLEQLRKNDWKPNITEPLVVMEKDSQTQLELNLDKQMKAWKENNHWVDQPPEINVTVPKGSLCNLNLRVKVGLPPDAVFNIIIDPENKRVFKNIKEVISRKVLVDEGMRQVVEVEQAALWRFLWWSGTISVHVYVDQNRRNHTVKFKQGKSGFMKKFEGCWKIEPFFVDEQLCYPDNPETLAEYNVCTAGKGRVGSILNLQQLIQPAIVPPPPISWYLRGITTKTTQMLINDLVTETARLRGGLSDTVSEQDLVPNYSNSEHSSTPDIINIKERWFQRRRMGKHRRLRGQTP